MFPKRQLTRLLIVLLVLLLLDAILAQKPKKDKKDKLPKPSKDKKPKDAVKKEIPFVQKFYTKSYGKMKFDRKRVRMPAKGTLLGCVVKCWATSGCICARVSSVNNKCDTYLAHKDDPNDQQNKTLFNNYVYYSAIGSQPATSLGEKIPINRNQKTESKSSGSKHKKKALPWLQIDLKSEYIVTGVSLASKDAQSLHDFEIRVGNRQISRSPNGAVFRDNPLCFGHIGSKFLEANKPRTVNCEPCPLSGKYVTIQIVTDSGEDTLNLADLQVYGYLV